MAKIFFYLGVLLAGLINISKKEQPVTDDSKTKQHLVLKGLDKSINFQFFKGFKTLKD